MHHIARTAPPGGTTRPRSPVTAVLTVVVLAVLSVLGPATLPSGALGTGASGALGTGASGHLTSADHLRHDGTRAAAEHLRNDGTPTAADHLPNDGTPTAAEHLRYDGARADDGCDAARVVRAGTRHEQPHGEHPAPRGHPGTCGRSAHAAPCPLPNPHGPPTRRVPASPPHLAQDQGRAPPVFSGT
ncbi:hypothetical protein GCM10010234_39530 [Streptomyces hawaiiensis]|uniref:hypothetical protein n=1 Tax=Streptomyces hawaiiensis TaxID=67305 RepID=UPI0031E322D1